jgi:hypothetical protein
MATSKFANTNAIMYISMCEKHTIPFTSKSKKVDGELAEADKTGFIKFDFFVDPKNSATRYSKEFLISRMSAWRTGSSG